MASEKIPTRIDPTWVAILPVLLPGERSVEGGVAQTAQGHRLFADLRSGRCRGEH